MSDENNTSIVSKADLSSTTTSDHESSAQENPDQGQQPQPELTRDSIYYFDPVVFKVEGVLFKVPKHGFMVPGSMFCDMFSLPIPERQGAEGSDSNPINPPSVTQEEFSGFLSMMYPYLGRLRPEINYEALAGALKLSTMWQYEEIRSNAIYLLSAVPNFLQVAHGYSLAVKNVLLAQQYRSKKLLRVGLITLISEDGTIEGLRHRYGVDWETISKIFAAKTHLMKENQSLKIETLHKDLVRDYVDIIFKEDLEVMESEYEVDDDDIEIFERYLSKRSYGDQTLAAAGTEVPSKSVQEKQTVLADSATDRPHHIYYLETLIIPVENTLFRLPTVDFLHISNRIPPDTSALSFHHFLSAFYSINEYQLLHYNQWLDVLDLSTLWGLTEIRQKAIKKMYPLIKERNLVETVLLARKYKVKAWMIGALEGLANRRANPDVDMDQELREPFELDWPTISKILAIQCQSLTIPAHLQRPDFCCRSCHLKHKNLKRGVCAHTCYNLELTIGDKEYTRFIEARDSGWTWSSDAESSEDIAGSDNKIREMIKARFREEIMDWPQ